MGWQVLATLPGATARAMDMAFTMDGTHYVCGHGDSKCSLWKSTDGENWTKSDIVTASVNTSIAKRDGSNEMVAVCAGNNYMYRSTNAGASWTQGGYLNGSGSHVHAFDGYFFQDSGWGIRYGTTGASSTRVVSPINEGPVGWAEFDGKLYFIGYSGSLVRRNTNTSWTNMGTITGSAGGLSRSAGVEFNGKLFVVKETKIFSSSNLSTWTTEQTCGAPVKDIKLINGQLYVSQSGGTPTLWTSDGEGSWSQLTNAVPSVVATFGTGEDLFAMTEWQESIYSNVPGYGDPGMPNTRMPVLQDFGWQPPATAIQNTPPA